MIKLPWRSRAIRYEDVGFGQYEASEEVEIVLVREAVSEICVRTLRDVAKSSQSMASKLRHCPFMMLGPTTAVSAQRVVYTWNDDDYAVVPSTLVNEGDVVYLNYDTQIDCYAPGFQSGQPVFCTTMCLPRCIHAGVIPKLQNYREHTIQKQMDSWRILIQNTESYDCYNAATMTMVKRI